MTGAPRANQPSHVGQWMILERLGGGGNAEVWRATRDNGEGECALKVIRQNRVEKEPYQRFVGEIAVLRKVGDLPGILPLVDAHLPETPSSADPAWLAMPIANTLSGALVDASLGRVVEAAMQVAQTLVSLKAEHRIGHRDIKPGNLYEMDGAALVGDFGLVAAPDLAQLTRDGKQLGPAHYTADEMMRDPVNADPFPADVYSLAKTLWVLATGQTVPPEGHQEAGTRGFSIADYRPHPRAGALDQLIDVSTLIHAEKRPTMEQFARDLEVWLELGSGEVLLDTGDIAMRIRGKMKAQLDQEDIEQHLKDLGAAAVRRLQELSRPLHNELRKDHPRPEFGLATDKLTRNYLLTHPASGTPDIVFQWQCCDRIAAGPDYSIYSLRMGRAIEVTAGGDLLFSSHIHVGREGVMGGQYSWRSGTRKARAGSIECDRMLEEGAKELAEHLVQALDAFAEHMPSG